MLVRAKKAAAAWKGQNPAPPVMTEPYNFPAPIRGWVLNENRATAQPGGARVLDNWVCTTTGIRVRGGAARYATLPGAVVSVLPYRAAVPAFFAATDAGIFDCTTVADPDAPLTATVSGLTSGDFATAQFGTAGGDFMYAVNGADDALLFDGSAWTAINALSTPAITGVSTADLTHVWSHANRLWFIEGGTFKAWYLGVDSIAGAATDFSLAGVFTKGGALLFGAKWSLSAGDGLDDKCVFVTTEGEVAVYEGTNPGSASTWRLAGRYDMPRPIGSQSYIQAGGDLLIATEIGLIPISAAINSDLGAIETKAVSQAISPYWASQAQALTGADWQLAKVNNSGVMVISQPDPTAESKTCLVVNLITGAWSRFIGWDTQCLCEYNSRGYFGSADGSVYLMESGGSDAGEIYTAAYLGQHDALGAYGRKKTIRQMRPLFQSGSPFAPLVAAKADFNDTLNPAPSSPIDYSADVWDVALWDVGFWDARTSSQSSADWVSVGVTGTFIAPELQLTFGIGPTPDVEFVGMDAEYHIGVAVA